LSGDAIEPCLGGDVTFMFMPGSTLAVVVLAEVAKITAFDFALQKFLTVYTPE